VSRDQLTTDAHKPYLKAVETPAMAARIADRLWSVEDVVALIDAREAPPAKRGTYKPRRPKAA
jgi:hypothetical protein